jgi:hypothetical protein
VPRGRMLDVIERRISFMRGTVSDTAFRRRLGARVEVLDGPRAGTSTTVDGTGYFLLVFRDIQRATRFRATMDGHVTSTQTLQTFCAPCNRSRRNSPPATQMSWPRRSSLSWASSRM